MTNSVHLLASVEADFEKMTWTFGIGPVTRVSAGEFAILPSEDWERDSRRLQQAEALLRRIIETQNENTMGEQTYEACLSFFDPRPLA